MPNPVVPIITPNFTTCAPGWSGTLATLIAGGRIVIREAGGAGGTFVDQDIADEFMMPTSEWQAIEADDPLAVGVLGSAQWERKFGEPGSSWLYKARAGDTDLLLALWDSEPGQFSLMRTDGRVVQVVQGGPGEGPASEHLVL